MSKNAQRLSQVVSTFGPGAMVDLPTRSVVVGGLELWEMRGDAFTTIPEPRLTMRLEQLLKDQGRLDQAQEPVAAHAAGQRRQAGTASELHRRAGLSRLFRLRAGRDRRRSTARRRGAGGWCAGRTSTRAAGAASSSSTTARNRT